MEPTYDWLLDYEIRTSKRYRRGLAFAMLELPHQGEGFQPFLSLAFRDSDQVMPHNGYACIVMGETDRDGCLAALGRYRRQLNDPEVFFGVATFPDDGHQSETLLACAEDRLKRACKGENGGIVAYG